MMETLTTLVKDKKDSDQHLDASFDTRFYNILSLSLNGVEKNNRKKNKLNNHHLTYSTTHGPGYFKRFNNDYEDGKPLYFYHLIL